MSSESEKVTCDNVTEEPDGPLVDQERKFEELVSLERLRKTWKSVRREAKEHLVRDPIDCLDWAVTVGATLDQIRDDLLSGSYVPGSPTRYEAGKSKGSYRIMTVPNLRDALVYRLLSDAALDLALPAKVPGAYFSRRHHRTAVGRTFSLEEDPYLYFFQIWLRYQEYRTRTLMNEPYEILVVADITNYFDSISHELLMEYLSPLGLPRKAVALLGRLLEALKPLTGHSPNPRIGIPVDGFDCSRQLAHVFLFEHDRRIVDVYGENRYVRWMDDQSIGAQSETEARHIVNQLTRSLSSQRLTLNAGKTKFLSTSMVVSHFLLDENEQLSNWEEKHKPRLPEGLREAREEFETMCGSILGGQNVGQGNWDKVLKRMYGIAGRVGSDVLDYRMYDDLVDYPHLADRIFLTLAARNEAEKLISLFDRYVCSGESLFEDSEAAFFESSLRLSPAIEMEEVLRKLAHAFVLGQRPYRLQSAYGKASAVLCLYWFDTSPEELLSLFEPDRARSLPAVVARAWAATVSGRRRPLLAEVQGKLVGHPSDDVAKLLRFLADLFSGRVADVGAYASQKPKWPASGEFFDTRAWLQLELISKAGSDELRKRAKNDLCRFRELAESIPEKRTLARIESELTPL